MGGEYHMTAVGGMESWTGVFFIKEFRYPTMDQGGIGHLDQKSGPSTHKISHTNSESSPISWL